MLTVYDCIANAHDLRLVGLAAVICALASFTAISLLHHVHGDPSKFKILGRTKYWTDHVPWREYYMTRNEIFTIWKYYPKWSTKGFTLYRLARHALDLLLFGKRKLECFGMMYRGFLDGRAGRLGIRFLATSR